MRRCRHAFLGKIIINPRRAIALAQHFLKSARRIEPLVQSFSSHAQGIIDVLVWAGAKTVQGHSKTINTKLAHYFLLVDWLTLFLL